MKTKAEKSTMQKQINKIFLSAIVCCLLFACKSIENTRFPCLRIQSLEFTSRQIDKIDNYLNTFYHPTLNSSSLCIDTVVVVNVDSSKVGLYSAKILGYHFTPFFILKGLDGGVDILIKGDTSTYQSVISRYFEQHKDVLNHRTKRRIKKAIYCRSAKQSSA